MRRSIGDYNESVVRLYGSLRKRFNLEYNDTLDEVDRMFLKYNYPIIFISGDDSFSTEVIEEINESGNGEAFGFYRDGDHPYNNIVEVREMVPKLFEGGNNKFVFVSVDAKSRFRMEIPGSILVRVGNRQGMLWVDVVVTDEIREDEIIREVLPTDFLLFNRVIDELYLKRWEMRKDIFEKGYNITISEVSNLSKRYRSKGAFVCLKEEKIVGFIVYDFSADRDNRAFLNKETLFIRDIYVIEEYRRMGIASRLYDRVLSFAEKLKCTKIRFKVWAYDELTINFINSLHSKSLYSIYEIDV